MIYLFPMVNFLMKNFSLESLYEKLTYLSQETPVFDGTIRENLVFDREVSIRQLTILFRGCKKQPQFNLEKCVLS